MPTPKFDEDDRRYVISAVARHLGVALTPIGSRRKYLEDGDGRRYLVLGGYGAWHGIPHAIFEAERRKSPANTTLVIARRYPQSIDVFLGPFQPLLENQERLASTEGQYVFNLRSMGEHLVVREVPALLLSKLAMPPERC